MLVIIIPVFVNYPCSIIICFMFVFCLHCDLMHKKNNDYCDITLQKCNNDMQLMIERVCIRKYVKCIQDDIYKDTYEENGLLWNEIKIYHIFFK